jgi:hypothetical protein
MDEHTKVRWITIRVTLKADADDDEVVSEMDYELTHKDIVDTEVMEITGG